ncbi:kinesin-like protein KIF1B [Pelmatolapia mariae]|uniref:kinesin-like protein KIF1B n=1 Tax=Pelmatolapia mariae TaxID=158779 RepID=UPI003211CDC8
MRVTQIMAQISGVRGWALSPMEVKIGTEAGQQKVRAWGPGLEGGVVGKSADFVVEAVGPNVGFSQTKIECDDKGDGWCDMRCWPTEAVPATKLNTITKSNLGQCVSKYDLLVWFEISELEPTGEYIPAIVDHSGGLPCHGTYLLHQGIQRRITVTLIHEKGSELHWKDVHELVDFEAVWDSSLHNSLLLNRVTPYGEKIYMTSSAYLEVSRCSAVLYLFVRVFKSLDVIVSNTHPLSPHCSWTIASSLPLSPKTSARSFTPETPRFPPPRSLKNLFGTGYSKTPDWTPENSSRASSPSCSDYENFPMVPTLETSYLARAAKNEFLNLVPDIEEMRPGSVVSKKGLLSFVEPRSNSWGKHFVVVRRPYVFIYNSDQDPVERGVLNFSTAQVEYSEDQQAMLKTPNTFAVCTKHGGILLQANNEKDLNDWLYAFNPLLAGTIRSKLARRRSGLTKN